MSKKWYACCPLFFNTVCTLFEVASHDSSSLSLFMLCFMYSKHFVKLLSYPGEYELIHRPFALVRNLRGSPGSLFHPPNWCLQLEMTLSAGFAILNHVKPMCSCAFTLRGIAVKCTIASKANAHKTLEWKTDTYPITKKKKRYSKMLTLLYNIFFPSIWAKTNNFVNK